VEAVPGGRVVCGEPPAPAGGGSTAVGIGIPLAKLVKNGISCFISGGRLDNSLLIPIGVIMKRLLLTSIILIVFPSFVSANTGVFFGVGNQVIPIKNNDIQLIRENVDIKLTIEKDNGKFGVSFIPWANVTAKFILKNTAAKKVTLQMGFPFLDLQGFGDEKFVLDKINFTVNSNDKLIQSQLKEGLIEKQYDPEGLFKKVFAWNDSFDPNESKVVVVTYKLMMSVASANSIMRDFNGIGRKYYQIDKLIPALNYSFGYITKTAYTWKGPIEEAVFQLDSNAFLKELETTSLFDDPTPNKLPVSRPVYLENILPAGYEKKSGVYKWVFKGKVPEDGLSVNFLALYLPSKEAEVKPFVKASITKLEDATSDEYLSVLKQYYAMLAKYSKPTNPFLSGYFQDVRFINDKTQFLIEPDKKSVEAIAAKFDDLTR
jgi:hypothetical protein